MPKVLLSFYNMNILSKYEKKIQKYKPEYSLKPQIDEVNGKISEVNKSSCLAFLGVVIIIGILILICYSI